MSTEAAESIAPEGGGEESVESIESIESVEASDEGTEEGTTDATEETTEEGTEESTEETPDTPVEEARYSVTVDGKAVELTLDEMKRGFSMGAGAHKKFAEAAKIKREAETAIAKLQENPLQAFIEAGGDAKIFREFAEKYLYDEITYDKMSPEQKELEDLRRYKTEQDTRNTTESERKTTEAEQAQSAIYQQEYTKTFEAALTETGQAPSPAAVSRMAQIQLDALEAGYELPVKTAAEQYKTEQQDMVNNYLKSLDADALTSVIGKDRMKTIRKKDVAKLKNPQGKKGGTTPSAPKAEPKESMEDFFSALKG